MQRYLRPIFQEYLISSFSHYFVAQISRIWERISKIWERFFFKTTLCTKTTPGFVTGIIVKEISLHLWLLFLQRCRKMYPIVLLAQTIIFQLYTIDISLLSPSVNDMTKQISTLDLFIYNLAMLEERKGKFQPLYQN